MAQDYDVTLKILMENFSKDFVRLVFGERTVRIIELLGRELAATKHYVDALVRVNTDSEDFIFHAEFCSSYDTLIPERMYKYSAWIVDKYPGLGVYGVVLYINDADRNRSFTNVYEQIILGESRSYYKFDIIKIWELKAEDVLRQQIMGLLPLVPLMKYEAQETEWLIRETIRSLKVGVEDLSLRAETISGLYLFSGFKQLRTLVTKLLKEENMSEFLEQSETYQEILSKGRQEGWREGLKEGRQEGQREAWIGSILALMRARFGNIDENEIVSGLQSLDDARLNNFVVEAISVESLKAFKEMLDQAGTNSSTLTAG